MMGGVASLCQLWVIAVQGNPVNVLQVLAQNVLPGTTWLWLDLLLHLWVWEVVPYARLAEAFLAG